MSGIAAAFVRPLSSSPVTVYERLKHMIPRLAGRGQAGISVAAFMRKQGMAYGEARWSSSESVRIEHNEQNPRFQPHVAIAHIRCGCGELSNGGDVLPIVSKATAGRRLALALDGAMVNARAIRDEYLTQEQRESVKTDAELLVKCIEHCCERDFWRHGLAVNYESVFREIDDRIDGAISAVLLDANGNLVAFRNRSGLRPLENMQTDDGLLLFASENCAFADLEGKTRQILPGHIKYVDGTTGRSVDQSVTDKRHKAGLCSYEVIYLGNPNTVIGGQSLFRTRYNIGVGVGGLVARRLQAEAESTRTIVTSMPHTGGPYADGLHAALREHGLPVERREIVKTAFLQRTLLCTPGARKSRIAQKYCVHDTDLANTSIVVVDEALIRGDTSQAVTSMLLAAGAKAVHWAIGSPPIVAPNYYGMRIESLDELAFWQSWERLPSEPRAQSLRFHKMPLAALKCIESNIAASVGAATITYLPFSLLRPLLPPGAESFDLSPFTFEMPTAAGQRRADRNLRRLLGDQFHARSIDGEVRS
ncbi:hypothetical protein ML401_36450 (plasmid) [Bradyrhizobium sp. 62B]|uniref:hypothetical protein n=1 Tax=Bradyrhizobium sp. 62B TaxID=2898442 RepID=UPI002557DB10|nr:hypothetical protein ML401_36450 [Bradyrhizobium sp. 62B]